MCIFKKHQNWWIFVRHFNIDDGRKNIFSILCFIISRKVKMQLKHTHKKICAGYEEGAVTDWRCQKWFSEFCAGDFSLDDIPQSSRPVKLTAVKHNNGEQWMLHQQETADILKISKSSTEKHLQQLGYVEVQWKSLSLVWLFVTPGTIACQAPQSMGIL